MRHFNYRIAAGAPVRHQQTGVLEFLNYLKRVGVTLPDREAFALPRRLILLIPPHETRKHPLQGLLASLPERLESGIRPPRDDAAQPAKSALIGGNVHAAG